MFKVPFANQLERQVKRSFKPHVIFGGHNDSGLAMLHKNHLGTTGKPIIRMADGGLFDEMGNPQGIAQAMPQIFDPSTANLNSASNGSGGILFSGNIGAGDYAGEGTFQQDKKKPFLGMAGKDWLGLGLGALAGAVGSTGQGGAPAMASLYNPAIGAVAKVNHKAEGGPIDTPETGQNQKIFTDAMQALAGQSKDPDKAIESFVAHYGKDALMELKQHMEGASQPQQAIPSAPQSGGILSGPGDGQSDNISAVHTGTGQPVQVSDSEYVVPADAVAMLGNGSVKSGASKLDAGIAKLRKMKYGRAKQPKALRPNQNPIIG